MMYVVVFKKIPSCSVEVLDASSEDDAIDQATATYLSCIEPEVDIVTNKWAEE